MLVAPGRRRTAFGKDCPVTVATLRPARWLWARGKPPPVAEIRHPALVACPVPADPMVPQTSARSIQGRSVMRKSTMSRVLVAFLGVLALPLLGAGPAQGAAPNTVTPNTVTPNSSVFSGTLQPGASKTWVHNNAGTTNAFA